MTDYAVYLSSRAVRLRQRAHRLHCAGMALYLPACWAVVLDLVEPSWPVAAVLFCGVAADVASLVFSRLANRTSAELAGRLTSGLERSGP